VPEHTDQPAWIVLEYRSDIGGEFAPPEHKAIETLRSEPSRDANRLPNGGQTPLLLQAQGKPSLNQAGDPEDRLRRAIIIRMNCSTLPRSWA
jgi:hypothetical protein